MPWHQHRRVYNTAPNRISVSAHRSHNHYDNTSSCGTATQCSRKSVLSDTAVAAGLCVVAVADTGDTSEVANSYVDVPVSAAADDDGNCPGSYGTDAPV
jgi:hypothetical protein